MTDAAPPTPTPTPTPPGPRPATDHTWPMLCHLSALAYFFPVPLFGGVLGPLAVWLARRDVDPAVREHGKEALNFNISFLLWHLAALPFVLIVIGYLFIAVIFVAWIALLIIATIKASDGVAYRYPFTIRFID